MQSKRERRGDGSDIRHPTCSCIAQRHLLPRPAEPHFAPVALSDRGPCTLLGHFCQSHGACASRSDYAPFAFRRIATWTQCSYTSPARRIVSPAMPCSEGRKNVACGALNSRNAAQCTPSYDPPCTALRTGAGSDTLLAVYSCTPAWFVEKSSAIPDGAARRTTGSLPGRPHT